MFIFEVRQTGNRVRSKNVHCRHSSFPVAPSASNYVTPYPLGTAPTPSCVRCLSPLAHSDVSSGKVGFHLGKESVPRHRLQALLTRGDFDRALDLARAHSMDETDVHAARLLALLRDGGLSVARKIDAQVLLAANYCSSCRCHVFGASCCWFLESQLVDILRFTICPRRMPARINNYGPSVTPLFVSFGHKTDDTKTTLLSSDRLDHMHHKNLDYHDNNKTTHTAGVIAEDGDTAKGTLSSTFFEDVQGLFEKIDSPAALGRACEAAVRAPLPSLEDVRSVLEVGQRAVPVIRELPERTSTFSGWIPRSIVVRFSWCPHTQHPPQPTSSYNVGRTGLQRVRAW